MACNLKPDPSHVNDALCAINATATVLVTSADTPLMRIVNANLNGVPLAVANGSVDLPALPAGNNVLNLVVMPGQTGDEVVLTEDCKDGSTRPLKKKFIGGGANPVVGYTIHAA
jgi:hypothetical protein